MSADQVIEEFRVRRLTLVPGEILVITTPTEISQDTAARLTDAIKEYLPDNKVLILGDGLDVSTVITWDRIKELAAA